MGALPADTPADAAREADAVVVMVSDPTALRNVAEGAEGFVGTLAAPGVLVQMATVGPAAVQRLAATLAPGVGLVDAPVLGSLAEADAGTLRIFAGGEPELVERVEPLLSALGTVVQVGGVGAGSAAKLVANSTLFGTLGVLGEALGLAKALGLPRDVALEILAATPVAAQAERRRPSLESGEYPPRFSLSLALKDADLMLEAAEASGTHLRLARAARDWLAQTVDAGRGDEDYSVVLEQITREAGGADGPPAPPDLG